MRRSFLVMLMLALLQTSAVESATNPPVVEVPKALDQPVTHLVEQAPIAISEVAPGVYLVDFGRVAFGNLSLRPMASAGDAEAAGQ